MSALLQLQGLHVAYGRTEVVHGIDLFVAPGEMVVLLGANGAGKTSVLRAISQQGVVCHGRVRFDGQPLDGREPAEVARLGIAHVPEGRGTFADLSVRDNLRVGAMRRRDAAAIARDVERMCALFPRLGERLEQAAGALSGGEQQMLAIARALMMRPRLLLLDEPSFGVAPRITQEIYDLLARLRADEGLTALIVEQNAELALGLADRAYVLQSGLMVLQGRAQDLKNDPAVRDSYLGA